MESVFTAANEHGMERHPESIKCERQKRLCPDIPSGAKCATREGTAHPTGVRSKKPDSRLLQARSSHGLPMQSHKCNVP